MTSKIFISLVAAVGLVLFMSLFTVNEMERAILFRFGEIKRADIKPGLHFKIPIVNKVKKFDARILTLDAQPELFFTSEKKNVIVDFFVKWRIDNVSQYYVATGGDEKQANARLSQIIKDELRDEFAKRTIHDVISSQRGEIMDVMRTKSTDLTRQLGIKVVDVRVSRIDYSEDVSESVYGRMRAERIRVAKDFRARGQEEAEILRAKADRERTVLLANAYREAEILRGEGDAKAAQIYASAFGQNEEFYAFVRSLNAYVNTFSGKNDVLIMQPDSEFFRYFREYNNN